MADEVRNVDAALKELRREEGNKRCFECTERGPSYVDMDHGTFVCTSCAGILREFTFKIKGLSMATFTAAEIKTLKTGEGNVGAEKVWLTRFQGDRPQPGDKDSVRTFIRDKYVGKKWIEKKKKQTNVSDNEESDEASVKSKKKSSSDTKAAAKVKRNDSFQSEEGLEEDEKVEKKSKIKESGRQKSISSEEEVKEVKKPQKTQKSAAKPAKNEQLLDMDFGFGSPDAPAITTDDDDDFADFVTASTAAPPPAPVAAPALKHVAAPALKMNDPFDFGDFSDAMPSKPPARSPSFPSVFPQFSQPATTPSASQQMPSFNMQSNVGGMSNNFAQQQNGPQQSSGFPYFPPAQAQAQPQMQAAPPPNMAFDAAGMMQTLQSNPQMMAMMMAMMQQQQQQPGLQPQMQGQPMQQAQQSFAPPQQQPGALGGFGMPASMGFPPAVSSSNPTNPFVNPAKPSNPITEDIFGSFT